jgi:hypothetical protein
MTEALALSKYLFCTFNCCSSDALGYDVVFRVLRVVPKRVKRAKVGRHGVRV